MLALAAQPRTAQAQQLQGRLPVQPLWHRCLRQQVRSCGDVVLGRRSSARLQQMHRLERGMHLLRLGSLRRQRCL